MIKNFNTQDFLENYWQKKPILIRAAFPDFNSPISAEELAGLACEDFIESRIISEHTNTPRWKLENGPFSEQRFETLPQTHWTLLIQGVNKILPEFDDLLNQFNFIPSWRVDDLMASYAAPEGSVGPHIDQYDVFLLQVSGRRKWMISETPIAEDNYEKDLPLKIIKNFTSQSEWILEAGDMLYLPPNVAHYGIGQVDEDDAGCMTFSIGFRAPSHAELLTSYIDDQLVNMGDELRYKDPLLSADSNPGEISSAAIDNIQNILRDQFEDKEKLAQWFGKFITEYLNDAEQIDNSEIYSKDEFIKQFKSNANLRRPTHIRANYIINKSKQLELYVNGESYKVETPEIELAKLFCNQHLISYSSLENHIKNNEKNVMSYFYGLYESGFIELE